MLQTIWAFISAPENRETLGWLGGGIVVVVGGVWAVVKFFAGEKKTPKPPVSADHGGVAIGGNVSNSRIDTDGGRRR